MQVTDIKIPIDKVLLFDYHRTMENKVDLVKIFKALSCEQRLSLFKNLYEWYEEGKNEEGEYTFTNGVDKCFSKACCCMDLSRSTISHHFKELQNAGLISYTRNGQSFVCKVNSEAIQAIRGFLK